MAKWNIGDLVVVNTRPDTQVYQIAKIENGAATLTYRVAGRSFPSRLCSGGEPVYLGLLQAPNKAQLVSNLKSFMSPD